MTDTPIQLHNRSNPSVPLYHSKGHYGLEDIPIINIPEIDGRPAEVNVRLISLLVSHVHAFQSIHTCIAHVYLPMLTTSRYQLIDILSRWKLSWIICLLPPIWSICTGCAFLSSTLPTMNGTFEPCLTFLMFAPLDSWRRVRIWCSTSGCCSELANGAHKFDESYLRCSINRTSCFLMPWNLNPCPKEDVRVGDPSNKWLEFGGYWGCVYNATKHKRTEDLETPLQKDMVQVWQRSWAVIRIQAWNPGYWFFHWSISRSPSVWKDK